MSLRPSRPSRLPPWLLLVARIAAPVALFVACNSGGVAATTLFPTTAHTLNYGAILRLSINPQDISTIQSPTVFGNIRLDFDGPLPAPGILAQVQVKERITELLARPNVSVTSLEPGPMEMQEAARDAGVGLGWRFAAGAAFVALLTLGGYAGWSRRPPPPLVTATVTGTWVVSVAATFAVVALTYQPARLAEFTSTGIIGTVQRNADLLAGVEDRAAQTTPYLKNLLALSSALQNKYAPQELSRPAAARVLLVSDIHGANQYPLMRTIVAQEEVDAVVDSGDLVNFGSVAEAEAAGIFAGIESLGVPYLFVRGNHDARSADDTALMRRLARVPNVVLLQPDQDHYTVHSVNGVRIAGFNDPRWFGDDNRGNAAKQKAPAKAFRSAFDAVAPPDIVVSHEPAAVTDLPGPGIRVHGHMHVNTVQDNIIGIGTFTGGGPFSHFIETGEEELTGQPSSFALAVFGEDCALTSLARYQYRNILEGAPAYDDVSLLNGARIETEVPPAAAAEGEQPGRRVCGPDAEGGREDVPAAGPP